METSYFDKIFYLKKDELFILRMHKKISTRTIRQGKRLKAIKENYIDKNKEKVMILCEVYTYAIYTLQGIFLTFMYKSALPKNFPIFGLILYIFFFFCLHRPLPALFYPFLKKVSSCYCTLEYVQ